MQIPLKVRQFAVLVHSETGKPIQEILCTIVDSIKNAILEFTKELLCPFCGSKLTRVTTTRSGETEVERYHSCDFCGNTFKSIQPKLKTEVAKIPENQIQKIAYKGKNRHSKNRNRK